MVSAVVSGITGVLLVSATSLAASYRVVGTYCRGTLDSQINYRYCVNKPSERCALVTEEGGGTRSTCVELRGNEELDPLGTICKGTLDDAAIRCSTPRNSDDPGEACVLEAEDGLDTKARCESKR